MLVTKMDQNLSQEVVAHDVRRHTSEEWDADSLVDTMVKNGKQTPLEW